MGAEEGVVGAELEIVADAVLLEAAVFAALEAGGGLVPGALVVEDHGAGAVFVALDVFGLVEEIGVGSGHNDPDIVRPGAGGHS